MVQEQARRNDGAVALSAVSGEGVERLLEIVEERLSGQRHVVELTVPLSDGATLAWLYRHGDVVSRDDREELAHLRVGLDESDLARLRHRLPDAGFPAG